MVEVELTHDSITLCWETKFMGSFPVMTKGKEALFGGCAEPTIFLHACNQRSVLSEI